MPVFALQVSRLINSHHQAAPNHPLHLTTRTNSSLCSQLGLSFPSSLPPPPLVVLGGKCNAPRETGENNNCLGGGSYNDCVARNNQLCTGECFGQPAGGARAPCYTGCTTRNQQYCAGYCMKISNCDDCIKCLREMGAAGSDEQHKETCSQEGDSYYCNCDS